MGIEKNPSFQFGEFHEFFGINQVQPFKD